MAGPKWDGNVPIEGDRICFYRQMGEVGCDANKYGGDVTDVSRQHGAVSDLQEVFSYRCQTGTGIKLQRLASLQVIWRRLSGLSINAVGSFN